MRTVPIPNPPLRDGVVALRPWVQADAPSLRPGCGDRAICEFSTVPWSYSLDAAEAWISRQESKRRDGRGLSLAVIPQGSPAPVGTVLLTALAEERRTARFGYWLIAEARGRSYVSRSGRLLLDWALRDLELLRVELVILPENVSSQRVAAAIGATCDGLQEGHLRHRDEQLDAYVYAYSR